MKKIVAGALFLLLVPSGTTRADAADSVRELRQKGFAALNQHRYKDALVLFDKTVQLDPKFTEGYIERGKCYRALGNCPGPGSIRPVQCTLR